MKRIKKIGVLIAAAAITVISLSGCFKPMPLSMEGNGVVPVPSEPVWLREYGPERSGHFRSMAVADFNNDGNLDIVGGSYEPGAIFLWFGDGFGNWERVQRFRIMGDIRSLAAGDVNNDGFPDIVSTSRGDTKGVQLWINNKGSDGNPNFFQPVKSVIEKELFEGVKLADINHDGNLDIIAANSSDVAIGGIHAWLGDGKGNFIKETGPTRKGIYYDVAVADIDKDGNPDIVAAGWGAVDGGLRAWFGSGDGRWSATKDIEKGSFWGVTLEDVDGDGNLDMIAASNFGGVSVLYGDGKGNFPRQDKLAEKGSFWRAKAIDLDKDGRCCLDVVATSNDGKGIVVWHQQPDNKEGEKRWIARDEGLPANGFYFDLVFADFNHDGRTDLAVSTYGEGIKVWLRSPGVPYKVKKEIVKETKIIEKETIVEKNTITIPVFYTAVFFDTGKDDIRPESTIILNNVAEFVKRVEGTVVKLGGYADPRRIMTKEFPDNKILSQKRARQVADYLVKAGIPEAKIEEASFGDSVLKYKGEDLNSYQKNRRVDITIIYRGPDSPGQEKLKATTVPVVNPDADDKKKSGSIGNSQSPAFDTGDGSEKLLPVDPFLETGDVVPVVDYRTFKLINNIPEYRIGSGDVLEVVVWEGIKENTYKVIVSPQGTLSFSYVKNFKASGFTQTELEREFVVILAKYVNDPMVKVHVPYKEAHKASIFGAIRDLQRQPTGPGTYVMYGRERLSQFLSRVGGHLPNADLTRVQLTRKKKTYFVNLFDAIFKADLRQDVLIDAGDVVFVPSRSEVKNKVFVFGEIMRPGLFQYEVSITLLEAIIRAGGPSFYGKANDVFVIRGDETKPEALRINIKDIYEKGDFRQNIALQNNDIVYVPTNLPGDIRDMVRSVYPFLAVMRLPMDVYGASALPRTEGFPLLRDAAPTPSTVISTPQLPQTEGGAWGAQ